MTGFFSVRISFSEVTQALNFFSNSAAHFPVVSHPERKTCKTASSSAFVIDALKNGTFISFIYLPHKNQVLYYITKFLNFHKKNKYKTNLVQLFIITNLCVFDYRF